VIGQGTWDGVLLPSSVHQDPFGSGGTVGELTGDFLWFSNGPLENALARDSGFGLPSTNVVLPIMALYAILIGPLAFFVLNRMGKGQLLWFALPALAFLFTAGIWVAGSVLRANTADAHGSIVEIRDDSATAQSLILRSSRNGGTSTIDLPSGWKAEMSGTRFSGGSTGATRLIDGQTIAADLDAGAFALMAASGPAPGLAGGIEVSALSEKNGLITGTVTNRLDVAIDDVAVFAPFMGVNIGTVAAGESKTFELAGAEVNPRFQEPVDLTVWPGTNGFEFDPFGQPIAPDSDSPVAIELWTSFMQSNTGRVRNLGEVTVVGWTRDLPSELDSDITQGRTALVRKAPVDFGDTFTDMASARTLIRGPEQVERRNNFERGFEVTSAWRFDLPLSVDPDSVALEISSSMSIVELWDGTEWLELEDLDDGLYAIPDGAFVGNSLFVQPTVDFDFDPFIGRDFSLQVPQAGDELESDFVDASASAGGQ